MDNKNIKIIQKNILSRYDKNKRPLPRRETRDPYAIHVSEVMSQQTQVERVIPYRKTRMQDFPTYKELALASKKDLLTHRSGLGFNSRAIRLQECAKRIIELNNSNLPKSREKLLSLPGIGPYTASAICSFARNLPEPVIDTNIRRVLIFLLKLPEKISHKELEDIAKTLIPKNRSRDRNNALMDYGATHLTAHKTKIKSLGKQSKFKGSDREVRGWIIKYLTKKENFLEIEKIKKEFPHKDTEKIIQSMINENLIKKEGNNLVL